MRVIDCEPAFICCFKAMLVDSINERLSAWPHYDDYAMATCLDPWFKSLACIDKDRRGHVWQELSQLAQTSLAYGPAVGGTAFLRACAFQTVIGDLINVSQPTVCRVVSNITDLITRERFPKAVQFPDATGRRSVTHAFYKIAKFPGVTGCIDCTHVRIRSPGGDDAEVFSNRKGYFSINVQFFDVVASWPGTVHDSTSFDNCRAKVLYEEALMTGLLLGDMGYAYTP
ncbi:hypothetical protein HPB47_027195 [Ixodes persulcatus]|uniref:Uncharacterized protein n=1 Tax=Ixodes persulcatus TaxID=34615 RepID=A0AC60PY75_IXOPE|nr:hypothetical protein HPB47_027195 [Ixodes persulcatus]